MNRLPALAGLQCLAFLLAMGNGKPVLAVSFLPLAVHVLLILIVIGVYLTAAFRIL